MTLNPLKMYTNLLKNPKTKWVTVILTVLYLVSPIDFVPDFLLPFGLIDDGIILTTLIVALREISATKKYVDVEPKK